MGSGGGTLALGTGSELGEVAVVITLPVYNVSAMSRHEVCPHQSRLECNSHLVVEDLGLSSLGLGDESLIKNVKHILAHLLQLGLDLLAVIADDTDVLIGALVFLLLLDGGNDAPGGTAGADHVLVSDGKQVTLINSELATNLNTCQSQIP